MRASTSPLGAELARWGGTQPPRPSEAYCLTCAHCRKRYSYMLPQMRRDWSAVRVRRGSLSSLPALTRPSRERGCVGPSVREQYRICKSEQTKKESTEPEPDTATWTHTTHTDTDRHTHTRTDATRPFRGIQSRIHQFRQCCTACKRGQLAQAEAAWHGAHFLYQAVSSPAVLL